MAAATIILVSGCTGFAPPRTGLTTSAAPEELVDVAFTSTGGSERGADVEWLPGGSLRLEFARQDDALTAVLATPCNTVNVPVYVRGRSLFPDTDAIASTVQGCLDEAGAQEHWATAFVTQPMTFTRTGATLVLKTSDAEIDFRS